MSYLKNYLSALMYFACFFGVMYLLGGALLGGDVIARYYCFLSIVGALAGPVGISICSSKTS